jgi:uncharacterized protein
MLEYIQKTAATLIIFFLLLFVYIKLAGPIPFSINAVNTNKSDTFSVTGEGIASLKPNSSTVTVGVSATGTTAKAAQDNMNTNINKVITAIKELGVPEKDIQTQNYNVNPTYEYTSGSQKVTGYTGNTNITIKLDDPQKSNTVLDTAVSNGATNVGGISFDNSDKTSAENEARKKAIESARKKAEDAASAAGFKLGKVINYSEGFEGAPIPLRAYDSANSKDVATQIEPGTNEVRISVTLSFEVL